MLFVSFRKYILFFLLTLVLVISSSEVTMSQPPPPPGGGAAGSGHNLNDNQGAPIGDGSVFFLVLSMSYGLKIRQVQVSKRNREAGNPAEHRNISN